MKAFSIPAAAKIHIYQQPVHMAAGWAKLSELANRARLARGASGATSGDLFVFLNKARNYTKILWWHRDGWNIYAKIVPRGTLDVPEDKTASSPAEMDLILERVILNGSKKLRAAQLVRRAA